MKQAEFTIIVDSREQQPYFGAARARGVPLEVPVEVRGLPSGDYSIAGHESEIVIERKSMPDLFGCVGQGRERFERELERLAAIPSAHLVCEFGFVDVFERPPDRSLVRPRSVVGSLLAWSARYRVHVWFAGRRAAAEWLTFEILRRWHLEHQAASTAAEAVA